MDNGLAILLWSGIVTCHSLKEISLLIQHCVLMLILMC